MIALSRTRGETGLHATAYLRFAAREQWRYAA